MSIEIASVKLNLKGKEIELSVADARELKSALEALLGATPSYAPVYVYPPYWAKPAWQIENGQSTYPPNTLWSSADGTCSLNFRAAPAPTTHTIAG